MTYYSFLFSQLFMNHVQNNNTEFTDLEYDVVYGKVIEHRERFLISKFNVDTKSEYECIVEYLEAEIPAKNSTADLLSLTNELHRKLGNSESNIKYSVCWMTQNKTQDNRFIHEDEYENFDDLETAQHRFGLVSSLPSTYTANLTLVLDSTEH